MDSNNSTDDQSVHGGSIQPPWYAGKIRHGMRLGFALVLLICFVSQWRAFSAESDVFRSRIQVDTYERGILFTWFDTPQGRPAGVAVLKRDELPPLESRFGREATNRRILGLQTWSFSPAFSAAGGTEHGVLIPYVHLLIFFGVGVIIQAVWAAERTKQEAIEASEKGAHDAQPDENK